VDVVDRRRACEAGDEYEGRLGSGSLNCVNQYKLSWNSKLLVHTFANGLPAPFRPLGEKSKFLAVCVS
jgi:hypothetical protein